MDDSDCPLTIAINALQIPRFVLRLKSKLISSEKIEASSLEKHSSLETCDSVAVENHNSLSTQSSQSSTTRPILKHNSESGSFKTSIEKNVTILPVVIDQSTGSTVKISDGHSKKVKRTRSFTHIASMVRKKKNADKLDTSELSTYNLAPGILKVFGDHVSPGSNYKSVRASTISTAKEVVKQALEKYGLEHANPNDFVLCDVVGHFKADTNSKKKDFEEAQWVTEYARVVNENEKPLVVQALWKPAAGMLRRFELVKKIEVESSFFFINTAENVNRNSYTPSPNADHTDSERSSIISASEVSHRRDGSLLSYAAAGEDTTLAGMSSGDTRNGILAPAASPFLLLLKGYNDRLDHVFFPIDKNTITIGKPAEGIIADTPDMCLHSPDVLAEHCFLHRKVSLEKGSRETNIDDINFSLFVDPAPGAAVFINGNIIKQSALIKPGQLLSIGSDYCFLFKDPLQVGEQKLKLNWLDSLKQINSKIGIDEKNGNLKNKAVQTDPGLDVAEDRIIVSTKEESSITELDATAKTLTTTELQQSNMFQRSHVTLTYKYKDEDELLKTVIHFMDEDNSRFRITPAYILTMMIEHSCAYFPEQRTRKLLLKISSALQGIAWVSLFVISF